MTVRNDARVHENAQEYTTGCGNLVPRVLVRARGNKGSRPWERGWGWGRVLTLPTRGENRWRYWDRVTMQRANKIPHFSHQYFGWCDSDNTFLATSFWFLAKYLKKTHIKIFSNATKYQFVPVCIREFRKISLNYTCQCSFCALVSWMRLLDKNSQ
jgi:hypothetical protein